MKVVYTSACLDSSGYAEAARNNIAALNQVGIDLSVNPVSFEGKKTNQGKLGNLIKRLARKPREGKIQILHLTPEHFPKMVTSDKYNIGYTAWETDRLPSKWVGYINSLDEVWVPSVHNVEVFKSSGVIIPVFCIPHTFNADTRLKQESILEDKRVSDFTFYSIFQWLERKNPAGLIRAYLTEFTADDDVVLVLKTFSLNPGSPQETSSIKERIATLKKTLYLDNYPRMLLVSSLLSKDQIQSLHAKCDCYVALHRCEGFGIPIAEAMQASKPVITTGYGGPSDFVKHKDTGYIVDHTLTPVCNMPWDNYTGNMLWADPDLLQARKYMRTIYKNQKEAKEMGARGAQWIANNLSWEAVGEKMKARLKEISKDLK